MTDNNQNTLQEKNFFSRFCESAGRKILKKYVRKIRASRRVDPYAGRVMVSFSGRIKPESWAPHTSPGFYIKEDDAWKMFYLADSRPSEVSSLMMVEWLPEGVNFKNQIFPSQFCSTVKSDIDSKWLADYSRGLPFEERMVFNCNLWMHSHMSKNSVRWSVYDDLSIEQKVRGKNFLISVVVAPQDGALRYRCRIDLGAPFNLTVDDIPIFVIRCANIDHKAIKAEMDKEYQEKVTVIENDQHLLLYDRDDGFIFREGTDLFGDDSDSKGTR